MAKSQSAKSKTVIDSSVKGFSGEKNPSLLMKEKTVEEMAVRESQVHPFTANGVARERFTWSPETLVRK
ncbi:hypothetical protein [Synechococcus sp. CCY 9618]|uniref:hypothetical protein n=1 Tax=Synechococcus sp. CCY 9618 TaxID=2815602 RepID=UPI001C21F250|nr:hypothetical protein [Synechococcus sp. CCY 9618]